MVWRKRLIGICRARDSLEHQLLDVAPQKVLELRASRGDLSLGVDVGSPTVASTCNSLHLFSPSILSSSVRIFNTSQNGRCRECRERKESQKGEESDDQEESNRLGWNDPHDDHRRGRVFQQRWSRPGDQ